MFKNTKTIFLLGLFLVVATISGLSVQAKDVAKMPCKAKDKPAHSKMEKHHPKKEKKHKPCNYKMIGDKPMSEHCMKNKFYTEDHNVNNYRVEYTTNKVIPLAKKLKDKVASFEGVDLQSFSANENYSNINFYAPLDKAQEIYDDLINHSQVTSISENKSHVGSSYKTYFKRYKLFKALITNFDQIKEILLKDNLSDYEIAELKQLLIENKKNYKSSLKSYEKQINKAHFQLYLKQEKKDK